MAFSVTMAVLLYLDRFALNVMQPVVMKELDIDMSQMGWVTGAFFWAYALAQVPAGTLGDRWGARATLALFVAAWSLAFAAQALAISLVMLIVFRALQGVAQAGAYAVTAGFLKHWSPASTRGFANSSVSMGGRAGGVLTNVLTPLFVAAVIPMLLRLGWTNSEGQGAWRFVFLCYALLSLVWAVAFWWWFRNVPEEHAGVNAAELALLRDFSVAEASHDKVAATNAGPIPPWYVVFQNRNLWLLSCIMFCVNVGWIFLATSQTTYLSSVFKMSLVKAGSYTAFTAFAGMAGCICGGLATDWLVRVLGVVWGRRLPGVIACGGAATMYLVSLLLHTPETVALVFASVYFLNDFLLGSLWSTVQDVGRRNSGTMFGFINMSGNLGAAIFPPVIGMLVDAKNWEGVFIVSAGAFLVAFALWFLVDPRIKLPEHVAA
ncbi:MAG TPA: MFS transporter [Pirellulaceae bacterium]|nr:MFS transporter [Pirellulaceae bacterium]